MEFGAVAGNEINFQLKLSGNQEILDEVTEVRYDVKEWWGANRYAVSTGRATNFSSGNYRTWGRRWHTNGTGVKVGDCVLELGGTLISW